MSELHAALGLSLLPGTEEEIARRRQLCAVYDAALAGFDLARPVRPEGLEHNHAYYPVLLPGEATLLRVQRVLDEQGVHLRRYFYPALNTLPYLKAEWRSSCPVAEDAARRALCLPLYGFFPPEAAATVAALLTQACSGGGEYA